jgi:hypothetical protein
VPPCRDEVGTEDEPSHPGLRRCRLVAVDRRAVRRELAEDGSIGRCRHLELARLKLKRAPVAVYGARRQAPGVRTPIIGRVAAASPELARGDDDLGVRAMNEHGDDAAERSSSTPDV